MLEEWFVLGDAEVVEVKAIEGRRARASKQASERKKVSVHRILT
jgi:hypothetical protein